jgi:Holliday junction resolvasome RuvABC endonuclease subunit
MKISDIGKPQNLFAIDSSTNSIAFSHYIDGKLNKYGKIRFSGQDVYQKAGDACKKVYAYSKQNPIEYVVIESAIYANSPKTAMHLALVQGSIMGALSMNGAIRIVSASPVQWQNWIGNKRLTDMEKNWIREKTPGKSNSWYKQQERLFRKQRTMRLINNEFDTHIDDDDVADAIAVGWFAQNNWSKLISEPKNS